MRLLKIDTSAPSSGQGTRRDGSQTPASATLSPFTTSRSRTISAASSASSISIISPALSSANVSSTSVNIIPRSTSSASTYTAQPHDYIPWSPTETIQDEHEEPDPDCVLAMHDFVPEAGKANTCLAFQAGQIIHVLNRDTSGWWDGKIDDGRRGWFPSNYVTATANLLTEEELPKAKAFRPGHMHSVSAMSVTSWTSTSSPKHNTFTRKDHRPSMAEALGPEIDTYCPNIMVPLLHGLSLLQNAVRSNRVAHFQPSTACIIACVRSILSATGCLSRDAVLLDRFNPLRQERKRILSDLAALVSQAKKASEDVDDEQKELEVEIMLRLGGQVFAHVRRFLAVAVQCGVDLPEKDFSGSSEVGTGSRKGRDASLTEDEEYDEEDTYVRRSPIKPVSGTIHRPPFVQRKSEPIQSRIASRAKSTGDLRNQRSRIGGRPGPPLPPQKPQPSALKKHGTSPGIIRSALPHSNGHTKNGLSVSSLSSTSSFSSVESLRTPATPKFPNGPCSVAEVMEALRHTHDQYLSTIAAFIGHAHSHSRTSHASSTGHMFELVKEVVEMVCKLLTIVEAVMKHPDIPSHKVPNLKAAKQGLYNVASSLAESVRVLTGDGDEGKTEEQERVDLLRSATNALKAGGDCVNEVKKCLTWSVGDKPIIIRLLSPAEPESPGFSSRKLAGGEPAIAKAKSLSGLRAHYKTSEMQREQEEEDDDDDDENMESQTLTMPPPPPPRDENELYVGKLTAPRYSPTSPQLSDKGDKPLPPLFVHPGPVSHDLPSPVSVSRTDDDYTLWEGSQRAARPSEDKIVRGDLPPTPSVADSEIASRGMLSHDYALEDVAYNKDGGLVGASLNALVEKMTPHNNIVDPAFSSVFFLTFRMFASSADLVTAIIARYNLLPPSGLSEEDLYVWQQRKGVPVRLRVANFLKLWLESFWRSALDDPVLGSLMAFTRDALAVMFPNPSQRVMELIILRSQQTDTIISAKPDSRVKDAGMSLNPSSTMPPASAGSIADIPRPIMTKTLLSSLRVRGFSTISILDFDAMELARQMTIMESRLYCSITPEEVLETGKERPAGAPVANINVKAVTTLSTVITGWVAESILNEVDAKKRTALVKFFIKLSDRCNTLNNFSTQRSIMAALESSTISRLNQTWNGLPQKYKLQMESLRKLADHARNYSEYRSRLRNTSPPAVPFLGLYLTDVTFCREGNPSHRASPLAPETKLINFNKYHKLARIVQDMQRFQVSFNFKEIPEVQEYLAFTFEKSKHQGDIQDLYRRSLLIEPKQPADQPPTSDMRQLFGWASRSAPTPAPTALPTSPGPTFA